MSLCYKLETNKHCKSTTIFLKKGLRIECCYFAFTNYFSLFYQYQLEVYMTGRSLCHETVIARGGGKSPLGERREERGEGEREEERTRGEVDVGFCQGAVRR